MKNGIYQGSNPQSNCLTDEDLYKFIASPADSPHDAGIEQHLAVCSRCREELAEVLALLHPEADELPEPEPLSEAEIARTVALVQEVARKEDRKRQNSVWVRWGAAAAAVLMLLGAGAYGFYSYYVIGRSNQFLLEARAALGEVYAPESPSGLRLDLPFQSSATHRAPGADSAFERAASLFDQALGARPSLPEAHLGLGFIYLNRSQFARAREEFGQALDLKGDHLQALVGRGVAEYEEALDPRDPVRTRELLSAALADFDGALQQSPDSLAARYNRIWVLFQTGRHAEATAEIDRYLSLDDSSIQAARLRDLRARLSLAPTEEVDRQIDLAALNHDDAALVAMAGLIPEKIPAAIRAALKKGLRRDGSPGARVVPGYRDLSWAAGILEQSYAAASGDHSWQALLRFYAGLSPPQLARKRDLDLKFEQFMDIRQPTDAVLRATESLEPEYSRLRDLWQLVNIRQLRGERFYWSAQFARAEAEYREMLRYAALTAAPELQAKSLASIVSALAEQNRPDDEQAAIDELSRFAERHRLDEWKAYGAAYAGGLHNRLNQVQTSIEGYAIALAYAYRNRDVPRLVNILGKLLPILDRAGRPEDAWSLSEEATNMISASMASAGTAQAALMRPYYVNLLYKQGEFALGRGDLDRAQSSFQTGLAEPLREMSELECRLCLGLAQVHLDRRQYDAALPLLDRGQALAAAGPYVELEWQAFHFQGRRSRALGDFAAALGSWTRSIETLEQMRTQIVSGELREQFFARRYVPYREIVALLHDDLHDDTRARMFAGRAKSMTLREYLDVPARNRTVSGTDVAQALGALTIDYFFTDRALLAFVSNGKQQITVPLAAPRSELEREVKAFLESVRKGDETLFKSLSRKLYQELMAPILLLPVSANAGKLLIFPDGPLHLLPFAGLSDPQGKFLIERHGLGYAPSQDVLEHCLALGRGDAASRSRFILLLDGTANLPAGGRELAHLAQVYGAQARFLTARDAAGAAQITANVELIHFAGHAVVTNGAPALILQLAPERVQLDSREIRTWNLSRNRLVMLAGCETGIGPLAEGESPWGLIPAFFNAGAPALVLSLLPAEDAATEALSTRFYDLLAAGSMAKITALQRAQLSLLQDARTAGRLNPASWLPYILVGDPR